jgi:hypothetical protein
LGERDDLVEEGLDLVGERDDLVEEAFDLVGDRDNVVEEGDFVKGDEIVGEDDRPGKKFEKIEGPQKEFCPLCFVNTINTQCF